MKFINNQDGLTHRTVLLVLFLMFVSLFTGCAPTQEPELDFDLSKEPAFFRLTRLDGSMTTLEEFRGKRSLFVFWGSRCLRSRWLISEIQDDIQTEIIPTDVPVAFVNVDRFNDLERVTEAAAGVNKSRIEIMFSGNDVDDEAYVACSGKAIPLVVTFNEELVMQTSGIAGDGLNAALNYLSEATTPKKE